MDVLTNQRKKTITVGFNQWTLLTFLMISTNDIRGQFSVTPETDCTTGLLNTTTNFFRVERVIHATATDISKHPLVYFSTSTNAASGFSSECSYDLNNCGTWPPTVPFGCYCMKAGPGIYNVTFRRAAEIRYSNVFVNATWQTVTILQLPTIYNPNASDAAAMENTVILSGGSCTVEVATDRLVKYCCKNTAEPCVVSIEYRHQTISSSPCVQLQLPDDTDSETLTFSYSVCGQPSNIKLTCSPATTGQTVSLKFETPPSFSPTCTTLSAGQPYNLTAIVDDSTAGAAWLPFVTLYIQPRNSATRVMCQVDYARDYCLQNVDTLCCTQRKGPNLYTVQAQGTASEIFSRGQFRIEWFNPALTETRQATASFPVILGDSSLDVSVNNTHVCSSSGQDICEVDLTEGETAEFSCCVTGMENPTVTVTYFNGSSSVVQDTCNNGTVRATAHDTGVYQCKAVDGCGRTVAITVILSSTS